MNRKDLVEFLLKFGIDSDEIERFIGDRRVVVVNSNVFLSGEKFEKSQVYGGELLFVNLSKLLPSRFLLEFVRSCVKGIVSIKNEKQAVNFTYGRSLGMSSVKVNFRLEEGRYYVVEFDGEVLGYCDFDIQREFPIKNLMNIGDYLSES